VVRQSDRDTHVADLLSGRRRAELDSHVSGPVAGDHERVAAAALGADQVGHESGRVDEVGMRNILQRVNTSTAVTFHTLLDALELVDLEAVQADQLGRPGRAFAKAVRWDLGGRFGEQTRRQLP
jgi:hypothetical protein